MFPTSFAPTRGFCLLTSSFAPIFPCSHRRLLAPLRARLAPHTPRLALALAPLLLFQGIDATLHRVSRTVHAITKATTAITARVGRSIEGHVVPLLIDRPPRSENEASDRLAARLSRGAMLVGPPNVGKTTVLREIARVLSGGCNRVVVIVDKSLEIGGTGAIPHRAIGNARVIQVDQKGRQHTAMLEAVENQSPDFIVVDEISTKEEAAAARTISGRGVAVIATVHGETLAQIVGCPERSLLVGGVASVTLSGREAAEREDGRRQVQKRCGRPVFHTAIELRGFSDWVVRLVCLCVLSGQ